MPESLFLFLQLEYPWPLGPPDGRYLLRPGPDAEPERVVVLGTLAAARLAPGPRRSALTRRGARPALAATTAEAAPVATARATIVDPVPVSAERQAEAWLQALDAGRETDAALAVLNRVLHFHRISSADPHVAPVSAAQALVIRIGWGEGEQVADGEWRHARELVSEGSRPGARGRAGARRAARRSALDHELRFAQLLGGRRRALVCEELALRARLDLDEARLAHAAIELDRALTSAVGELDREGRQDLAIRIDELRKLRPGVAEQAQLALAGAGAAEGSGADAPDAEILGHALGRLEAALRARAAEDAVRT
jgi:hypothetical protein